MSGGNFARLTSGLLVRKGEAGPSPIARSETNPFVRPSAPAVVDASPVPASKRESERREPAAVLPPSDLPPPTTRRMVLKLTARQYEMLSLVAVRQCTTPQHLLRKALHELIIAFAGQCNGPCQCIESGWDESGEGSN